MRTSFIVRVIKYIPRCILRMIGQRSNRTDKPPAEAHAAISHAHSEPRPVFTKQLLDKLTSRSSLTLSTLFQDTVAELTPSEQTHLIALLDRIAQHPPTNENDEGCLVRRHIETEQQLPREQFIDFLRALLRAITDENISVIKEVYQEVSRVFAFKGKQIRVSSNILYRYVPTYNFLKSLVSGTKQTRAELSIELSERSEQARRGEISWGYVLQDIVECGIWTALPLDQIRLTNAVSMFVTFDYELPIDRSSTNNIWHALALYKPKPDALLEIQIKPPTSIDDLPRIPTLADAGWYSFFCSAGETELHGWTNPHSHTPPLPRQPEAVLRPLSLSVLSGPSCLRVLDP